MGEADVLRAIEDGLYISIDVYGGHKAFTRSMSLYQTHGLPHIFLTKIEKWPHGKILLPAAVPL